MIIGLSACLGMIMAVNYLLIFILEKMNLFWLCTALVCGHRHVFLSVSSVYNVGGGLCGLPSTSSELLGWYIK